MRFVIELAERGDAIALVEESGAETTYRELAADVAAFAARLGPDRRLVFLEAANSRHAIAAYLGCLLGRHPVYLFQQDQDKELLERLTARYQPNVFVTEAGGEMAIDWRDRAALPLHPDLRILLSTSGSTGSPKFVKLSEKNIQSNADSIAEYLQIVPEDRAITLLKFNYSYGMSVINANLTRGASLLLTDRSVTEKEFWALFRRNKATTFSGVPHTFETLAHAEAFLEESPSLRYATQAGGRLAPDLVQRFARLSRKSGWRFYVMYGQTEASPRIAYLPPDMAEAYPKSIGQAIPGGTIAIVDEAGAEIRDQGVPGELAYRGPNVMMGYAEDRGGLATEETPRELRTGDLACWNAAGLVEIVGRAARFVKPFGLRVNLDDVEAAVRRTEASAACTGTDQAIVIAFAGSGAQPARQAAVADLSRAYNLPPFVFRMVELPEIPRLANGKIAYQEILKAAGVSRSPDAAADTSPGFWDRFPKLRTELWLSRNQIATLLVSGLWHGAAWTFVSWGFFHGLMLVGQRQIGQRIKSLYRNSAILNRLSLPVQILLVFLLVAFSRILFRSPDFTTAMIVVEKIFGGPYDWKSIDGKAAIATGVAIIALTMFAESMVEYRIWRKYIARRRMLRAMFAAGALLLLLLIGNFTGGKFIYVRF